VPCSMDIGDGQPVINQSNRVIPPTVPANVDAGPHGELQAPGPGHSRKLSLAGLFFPTETACRFDRCCT